MADPLTDFPSIIQETIERVRARIDADANAGLDPADDRFIDTTIGGHYWDLTQSPALEISRLWDVAAHDVPSAIFITSSWGVYLDLHGEMLGVPRKPPVRAAGEATFRGVNGTFIAQNVELATQRVDVDQAPVSFVTAAAGQILPIPAGLVGTPSGSGGTLAAGPHYYVVTARQGTGETVGSEPITVTTAGAASSVLLEWGDIPGATGYRIYRANAPDGPYNLRASVSVATFTDVGGATSAPIPSAVNTTTLTLSILAQAAGSVGNVAGGAISVVLSPVDGIASVTNEAATSSGADDELDEAYRDRLWLEYSTPQGAGNVGDYKRWCLAELGVGFVTVEPLWAGAGTVRVVVRDPNNDPVPGLVVASLQGKLDPEAGKGYGDAPVGARVTVATPSLLTVTVSAIIEHQSGYSLDGLGGTSATRTNLIEEIADHLDTLAPGDDILINKLESLFFNVEGVYNVSGVLLNGFPSNVAVPPLSQPTLATPSFT